MNSKEYRSLYTRELKKLITEMELYSDEKNIWVIDKEIANSAGNLCLHLVGNLNYFIGYILGKTDYVRNREKEFSLKFIPLHTIVTEINNTILIVDKALLNLTDAQLKKVYPIEKFENPASTDFLLSHLLIHLSYHLGQINYHRRILDQ